MTDFLTVETRSRVMSQIRLRNMKNPRSLFAGHFGREDFEGGDVPASPSRVNQTSHLGHQECDLRGWAFLARTSGFLHLRKVRQIGITRSLALRNVTEKPTNGWFSLAGRLEILGLRGRDRRRGLRRDNRGRDCVRTRALKVLNQAPD